MGSSFTDRLGNTPNESVKAPVVVVTTTNITLSGEQTYGAVSISSGDRVGVGGQTDASENGIYVASTSTWARASDWDSDNDVISGVTVLDHSSGIFYFATFSGSFALDTTNVSFSQANALYNAYNTVANMVAAVASIPIGALTYNEERGAYFKCVTYSASDNDADIIAGDGLTKSFQLVPPKNLYAKNFGYYTNESKNLQFACNYAYNNGYDSVYLGDGNFTFSEYLTSEIPTACGTTLDGDVSFTLFLDKLDIIGNGPDKTSLAIYVDSSDVRVTTFAGFINIFSALPTEATKSVSSVGARGASNIKDYVVVNNTTDLSVGEKVILTGNIGGSASQSAERSPTQYLTIANISGTTVFFEEHLYQSFYGLSAPLLWYGINKDYPTDIGLKNMTITAAAGSPDAPYILMSRMYGFTAENLVIDGETTMQFGMSEKANYRHVITNRGATHSVEASSRVTLDDCTYNECSLLIHDNSKDVRVIDSRWSDFDLLQIAWGTSVTFENCIFGAAYSTSTVFLLGYLMGGFQTSKTNFEADKNQTLGATNESIKFLNSRFHVDNAGALMAIGNADVILENCELTARFGSADVVQFGETRETTADSTYYPLGGRGSLAFKNTRLKNLDATYNPEWISAHWGSAFLPSPAYVETALDFEGGVDTTIALVDGTYIAEGDRISYDNSANIFIGKYEVLVQTGIGPNNFNVQAAVSQGGVGVNPAVTDTTIPAGTKLCLLDKNDPITQKKISFINTRMDDVLLPEKLPDTIYPFLHGAGPYISAFPIYAPHVLIPGQSASYELTVTLESSAAVAVYKYLVMFNGDAGTPSSISEISSVLSDANFNVADVQVSGSIVTLNVTSDAAAESITVKYEFTDKSFNTGLYRRTGSNMITNGGADDGTTGWTTYLSSVAAVSGGQSDDCIELTPSGGRTCYPPAPGGLESGGYYELTVWVKSGTAGNVEFASKAYYNSGAGVTKAYTGRDSSAYWVAHSFTFQTVATTGNFYAFEIIPSVGTSTMLFDSATLYKLERD
jgi:hypothetical protein